MCISDDCMGLWRLFGNYSSLFVFQVSESLLSLYLDEYEEIPWDALKFLIAGINYGGHVTDDWDRRLLTTYINQYFCPAVIDTPFFKWVHT